METLSFILLFCKAGDNFWRGSGLCGSQELSHTDGFSVISTIVCLQKNVRLRTERKSRFYSYDILEGQGCIYIYIYVRTLCRTTPSYVTLWPSSLMEVRQVFIGCRTLQKGIIFSLQSYLYSLIFLVKSIIYQSNDGWSGERKQEKGGIMR